MASPINGNTIRTPAKQIIAEANHGLFESPWRKATDSPSVQLLLELSLQAIDNSREFHNRLDFQADQRAEAHRLELAAAAAHHEYVRQNAELVRQRTIQELEEQEQRQREEAIRTLHVRQQDLIQRKKETAAAKARYAEEAKSLARSPTPEPVAPVPLQPALQALSAPHLLSPKPEPAEHIKTPPQPPTIPNAFVKSPLPSISYPETVAVECKGDNFAGNISGRLLETSATRRVAARESTHQQYVALHQRLKVMRKFVIEQAKVNQELKKRVGNMRREIRKSLGQLTGEKGANTVPIRRIVTLLKEAATVQQPSLDIRPYILTHIPPDADTTDNQVPALLIYLLNAFSKAVIAQFANEASVTPPAADPTGIAAITIFAANDFRWKGISLIDMLIAKFHVMCPVLFGIYGSDKMEEGRRRLGWQRDPDSGSWVNEQRHSERMTGLGVGFAALSLRDFKNSKSVNPFPSGHFWRALACIINTPVQEITQTHCIVLKALIEHHISEFIGFYGQAGVVALRKAVIDFPGLAPKSVAASALLTLPATMRRIAHLTI